MTKAMYDDPKNVKTTFTEETMPEYLLQARWAEFVELKKAIHELSIRKKSPLTVLDIGIGDARIPKHLSGIEEIWRCISHYHGIDVAQNCIDLANKRIKKCGLEDKVEVKLFDAINLSQLKTRYNLIITTWFTAGNFYPSDFDFTTFTPGRNITRNDNFERIFRQAYDLVNQYGKIIIGSVYIDNENTRKIQEECYRCFGWTVITDEKDCFAATREGWWSQRFTKQRIYDYFNFIHKDKISFVPLDTYDFAMMIQIEK